MASSTPVISSQDGSQPIAGSAPRRPESLDVRQTAGTVRCLPGAGAGATTTGVVVSGTDESGDGAGVLLESTADDAEISDSLVADSDGVASAAAVSGGAVGDLRASQTTSAPATNTTAAEAATTNWQRRGVAGARRCGGSLMVHSRSS